MIDFGTSQSPKSTRPLPAFASLSMAGSVGLARKDGVLVLAAYPVVQDGDALLMPGLHIFHSHGTNTVTAATHAETVDGDVVRSLEIEAGLAATVAAIDTDRGGCSLDDDRLVIGARAVFVQPPAAG